MIFVFTVPLQAAVAAMARILSEDQPLQNTKQLSYMPHSAGIYKESQNKLLLSEILAVSLQKGAILEGKSTFLN